jgi:hypothetical protein
LTTPGNSGGHELKWRHWAWFISKVAIKRLDQLHEIPGDAFDSGSSPKR